MAQGQQIRPSQFITTYGVGSILEGPDGPRMVSALAESGLFTPPGGVGLPLPSATPIPYEIADPRLSASLLNRGRIFRLPTNDDLGETGGAAIYSSGTFPSWSLCVRPGHSLIYRLQYKPSEPSLEGCAMCGSLPRNEAWQKSRREAIRFVRACPAGHLDDVDWRRVIHSRNAGALCSGRAFRWRGRGASLRNIELTCEACGAQENLGQAYARRWPCSGRFAESRAIGACSQQSQILQRGAANLRIPELLTSLTIPPNSTALHNVLATYPFQVIMATANIRSKQDLLDVTKRTLGTAAAVTPGAIQTIEDCSSDEILRAIEDVRRGATPQSLQTMREDEFLALNKAAQEGAPPVASSNPSLPHQFEVVRQDVQVFARATGRRIRVTPVNRLRVVMVQVGYRRLSTDPAISALVDTCYEEAGQKWYPGVELSGEGIFLDLPEIDDHRLFGEHSKPWRKEFERTSDPLFHPVFVWWHTFAHRVISSLSLDSGYSSTAIRERIFVSTDARGTSARGGALLYTAQPGGDGSLGGLLALAPRFDRILDQAERYVDSCSNDPICGEENYGPGKVNGAACYACQLISETSCEMRNQRLDRNLLRTNTL